MVQWGGGACEYFSEAPVAPKVGCFLTDLYAMKFVQGSQIFNDWIRQNDTSKCKS
jgi:hypothetical protein